MFGNVVGWHIPSIVDFMVDACVLVADAEPCCCGEQCDYFGFLEFSVVGCCIIISKVKTISILVIPYFMHVLETQAMHYMILIINVIVISVYTDLNQKNFARCEVFETIS